MNELGERSYHTPRGLRQMRQIPVAGIPAQKTRKSSNATFINYIYNLDYEYIYNKIYSSAKKAREMLRLLIGLQDFKITKQTPVSLVNTDV
jgi:hypothetical protein